jgi:hypothetical protein
VNELAKTGIAVGVAVALGVFASMTGPREVRLEQFDDLGQEFFESFKDPAAATELQVVEFRESAGAAYPFVVKRDDKGRWTIPSHDNYPADAKDRMGKAAALVIGLRKQAFAGDAKGRHAEFGVVDPLDPSADAAGRGTRVTMKDSAGNVLADLIVGKEVEGKLQERYVRVPDKRRVYRVKLDGQVSTKFADWIETDLLKASSWDIAKVTFDNYSVNEQGRTLQEAIVPGEKLVVTKDSAGKWSVQGLDAAKEEPNEERLREIGDTLGQIKIVGVRQKPEGLTAALEHATGRDRTIIAQLLQPLGFFLATNGKMYSNEGDLLFETKKGVRYTLRFGELVPGEGDEVTSGKPAAPKPGEQPKDGEPAKAANNRYLMVTVEFAEDALEKPTGARIAKEQIDKRTEARTQIEAIQRALEAYRSKNENKLPETLAKLAEKPAEGEPLLKELKQDPWGNDYQLQVQGETYAVVSFAEGGADGGEGVAADVRSDRLPLEDELKKNADAWAEHDRKVEEGKKEVDRLTKRFGPWYYVIDQALFAKLKPKREDLVKPKAPAAPAETTPGGVTPPPGTTPPVTTPPGGTAPGGTTPNEPPK